MVATAPGGKAVGCTQLNTIPRATGAAGRESVHVMSIWTDLLFLGGHIATPAGLAAVAPQASSRSDAEPTEPRASAAATPTLVRAIGRATPRPRQPRPLPRPNKISPNDLW